MGISNMVHVTVRLWPDRVITLWNMTSPKKNTDQWKTNVKWHSWCLPLLASFLYGKMLHINQLISPMQLQRAHKCELNSFHISIDLIKLYLEMYAKHARCESKQPINVAIYAHLFDFSTSSTFENQDRKKNSKPSKISLKRRKHKISFMGPVLTEMQSRSFHLMHHETIYLFSFIARHRHSVR